MVILTLLEMTMLQTFITTLQKTFFRPSAPKNVKAISTGFEGLSLYYRHSCPFCRYVLTYMKINNIQIDLRDTAKDSLNLDALIQHGGKQQVPCLKIEKDGKDIWMYESADIVEFLKKRLRKA